MNIEEYISDALQATMEKQIAKYTSRDAVVRELNDRLNAALFDVERQAEKISLLRIEIAELNAEIKSYRDATIKYRVEDSEKRKHEVSTQAAMNLIVELSGKKKPKKGRKSK